MIDTVSRVLDYLNRVVDGINLGRQWKSVSRISFNEANSNDGVQCVSVVVVVVNGINKVIKKKKEKIKFLRRGEEVGFNKKKETEK